MVDDGGMIERERTRAEVRRLSLEGKSQADIARELGLNRNVVVGLVHRMRQKGELPPASPPPQSAEQRVETLARSGKTAEEIARIMRIKLVSVEWHLKRLRAKGVVVPLARVRNVVRKARAKPSPIRYNRSGLDGPAGSKAWEGCRYIYGDPKTVSWAFCGRPIAPRGETPMTGQHGVYCEAHLKECYFLDLKTKKKVEADQAAEDQDEPEDVKQIVEIAK